MPAQQHRLLRLPTLFALLFGIVLLVLAAPVNGDSDAGANSKPDLICHTSNPDDCYPRIFEPTDEFQKVHDDQELPHGLHVRMDVYTGEKEAKINVPDEIDPSLEGLPVHQDIVVVEPEARDEPIIPKGAPAYDNAGKIKGPQHAAKSFVDAMNFLRSGKGDTEPSFDAALDGLEDLSHDIYYGLQVVEDRDVVKALLCRMAHSTGTAAEGFPPRDQQAAAILAGSLQNNPTALAEVVKQWPSVMEHRCPSDGKPLRNTFFQSIAAPPVNDPVAIRAAANRVKAKVAAIGGLIKDPAIRADFLQHDGMRDLLRVLIPEEKEWATAQRKVGLFVIDNFLDEDMGAVTGQWPTGPKMVDEQCKKEEWRTAEGCWDYNVARIVKANKGDKGHWSKELQTRLAAVRKSGKVPPQHVEL